MNIAIVGYGKMGHMIKNAAERLGHRIVLTADPAASDADVKPASAEDTAPSAFDPARRRNDGLDGESSGCGKTRRRYGRRFTLFVEFFHRRQYVLQNRLRSRSPYERLFRLRCRGMGSAPQSKSRQPVRYGARNRTAHYGRIHGENENRLRLLSPKARRKRTEPCKHEVRFESRRAYRVFRRTSRHDRTYTPRSKPRGICFRRRPFSRTIFFRVENRNAAKRPRVYHAGYILIIINFGVPCRAAGRVLQDSASASFRSGSRLLRNASGVLPAADARNICAFIRSIY